MSAKSSEKSSKAPVYTILLGLIVAAIFLVAIFSYQVQETERTLVITMGRITGECAYAIVFTSTWGTSFCHWKAPWSASSPER